LNFFASFAPLREIILLVLKSDNICESVTMLYPLIFQPKFVEKIWGGRKIETVLGKKLPAEAKIGESWEIYDFPPGVVENSTHWNSSLIANGPLAGKTLHWAIGQYQRELMGGVAFAGRHGQFPALIKYLDAREDLSVQVHPDEKYASANPDAHLKSEAWYVVQHDPHARLLKGVAPGTHAGHFRSALESGTVEELLTSIPAKVGQCHYLPSGTIHALGAGILAAEVQTPSDTTFRVFDFNRVDPGTGKLRTLHIEQALACIDFDDKPLVEEPRSHVAGVFTTVTRLVRSPYFTIEKVRFSEGVDEPIPYDQPVVWMMLEGSAAIAVEGLSAPTTVSRGQTVLLPASMKNARLKTLSDCTWLEVTFPIAQP
jgi:mannose-6-phosphate isomerase